MKRITTRRSDVGVVMLAETGKLNRAYRELKAFSSVKSRRSIPRCHSGEIQGKDVNLKQPPGEWHLIVVRLGESTASAAAT